MPIHTVAVPSLVTATPRAHDAPTGRHAAGVLLALALCASGLACAGEAPEASLPLSAPPASAPASASAAPAQVAGLWCGDGLLASYRLELTQQAQAVSGRIHRRERSWPIAGHLEGGRLTTEDTPVGSLVLVREGPVLRLVGGKGPVALATGTRFTAARGGECGKA